MLSGTRWKVIFTRGTWTCVYHILMAIPQIQFFLNNKNNVIDDNALSSGELKPWNSNN